jgi:hypothetical protein
MAVGTVPSTVPFFFSVRAHDIARWGSWNHSGPFRWLHATAIPRRNNWHRVTGSTRRLQQRCGSRCFKILKFFAGYHRRRRLLLLLAVSCLRVTGNTCGLAAL